MGRYVSTHKSDGDKDSIVDEKISSERYKFSLEEDTASNSLVFDLPDKLDRDKVQRRKRIVLPDEHSLDSQTEMR